MTNTAPQTEQSGLTRLLWQVNSRVADLETRQKALRAEARALTWGSIEDNVNELAQRQLHGELLSFAYVQGTLSFMLGLPLNFEVQEVRSK